MKSGLFVLLSLACLVGMYIAYIYFKEDSNLFSLSIGLLGAGFGFFASKASAVKKRKAA